MILARQQLNERGRGGTRKIIVLITDGVPKEEGSRIEGSASRQSARNESILARGEGIEIFSIGVILRSGLQDEAKAELEAIAGDPQRVTFLTDFANLNRSLANNITGRICENGKPMYLKMYCAQFFTHLTAINNFAILPLPIAINIAIVITIIIIIVVIIFLFQLQLCLHLSVS